MLRIFKETIPSKIMKFTQNIHRHFINAKKI